MRPTTIAAIIFIIALCEAAFGQTLDLTTTPDAAQLTGDRTRTVSAGTRLDVASGTVWLPWTLRMGDRIDMDVFVGWGESMEGIAVGNQRILANRYQEWLKPWSSPGYWTTLSIGASGISEGGEVVAAYSPIQSASVGLWVNSDNAASALIVRSATFYEMRPTNTPTPEQTVTPTPTVEQPRDYALTIDATPDHSWWVEDRRAGWILKIEMWKVRGE